MALAGGEEGAMGEEHQHTWSPYLPEGNRCDLDEEELEFDEEEVKHRIFLASPEGRRGLELAKEQDPDFVAMVTEWCTNCPLRRGVKYEVEEVVKMEEEELRLLHLHHQEMEEGWWDSTEAEEGEVEGEEEESETKKGKSDLNAEESKRGDEEAVQTKTETDHSTLDCNIQHAYWRPWEVEEVEEKQEEGVEGECKEECLVWSEATHTNTYLSSEPVTPPALVTPRRPGEGTGGAPPSLLGGKRSLRRLLDFQGKLESTRGLPPSRLELERRSGGRVEGGRRVPVSHRRRVEGPRVLCWGCWASL